MEVKALLIILVICVASTQATVSRLKREDNSTLSRNKRYLIYPVNGGTLKLVIGFLFPVLPVSTNRSLNCAVNLQAQYDLPRNVSTHLKRIHLSNINHHRSFSPNGQAAPDKTRELFYQIIESILIKRGFNGRKCVQRTICEITEMPLKHNGLIGELLDTAFIPGDDDLHNDYVEAKNVGLLGADCSAVYAECPTGILDSILYNPD